MTFASALAAANLITEDAAQAVLLQKEQEATMWEARAAHKREAEQARIERCRRARRAKRGE